MIQSVKQIATLRAEDLPPTFDIMVGTTVYPFEFVAANYAEVYILDLTSGEEVIVPSREWVTVLLPDTLDNAAMDIELSLMTMGVL